MNEYKHWDNSKVNERDPWMSGPSSKRVRVLDQNDPKFINRMNPAPGDEDIVYYSPGERAKAEAELIARMKSRYGISVIECFTFGQFQAPTISLPENIVEGIVELNNVEEVLQRPPL